MTAAMLSLVTREQISRLHPSSKSELAGIRNNMLQIVLSHADAIANGAAKDPVESALIIAKTMRRYQAEMDELFATRNHSKHLGSEEAHNCERTGGGR